LVATAIDSFGSKKQQNKYLPLLNHGELVGCFALTEPDHGSDPSGIQTIAKKVAGGYKINGEKRWIGLAPYADIFILWAKDVAGEIRGFILEKEMPGIDVTMIEGKISLRIAPQGHIKLNDVFVPEENILPKASGMSAPFTCLNHARYGISWGALGAAEECLDVSLNYAKNRIQFGIPVASKQLIQKKLVDMQVEIALGLQACLQTGRLIETGDGSFLMINLLKYNSAGKALNIARNARDILGGNGILEEYGIMRHLVNLETVNTYEGTSDVHALTLGRALTGLSAF
jgi:glutaryl-CoA dehydrogenase